MSWTILSLGGSVIVPDDIDVAFLKKFRQLIVLLRRHRFVIVCGGGATNRRYNAAALALARPTPADLDWIGIRSLTLNAELVRAIFGRTAYPRVVERPADLVRSPRERVVVAAAFAPSRSSDYDAVLWAQRFRAKRIINLSNIAYVYTADPRADPRAAPLSAIRWADYRALVGARWTPRLSSPFDPIAARLAERLKLKVVVLDGRQLANVRRAIEEKHFTGTVLHP